MTELRLRKILGGLLLWTALGALSPAMGDEVPYVQSLTNVVDTMLSLAEVDPQDFVVDLGSGEGRIVIAAAKRYGARGLGIELDDTLVAQSRANAARAGVSDRMAFLHQDIFLADFSDATVVTMYLLPDVNFQIRPRILLELGPGTRIVSHDYDLGDWPPERQVVVEAPNKTVGPRKESAVYLWIVPARVAGYWRGTLTGPQGEEPVLIEVLQRFQNVSATMWLPHWHMAGSGRIRGDSVSLSLGRSGVPGSGPLRFTLRPPKAAWKAKRSMATSATPCAPPRSSTDPVDPSLAIRGPDTTSTSLAAWSAPLSGRGFLPDKATKAAPSSFTGLPS